jgi:NADP-dependent 3-hydroxy acid dehydrogenase YdfG
MSPTVYLVSGANRGIGTPPSVYHAAVVIDAMNLTGLGLTKALVVRKDVVVFAGARQPDAAEELQALAKDHPGQLHVLKLTSADEVNNREAIDKIKKVVGRLDVVVANAGTASAGSHAFTY